MIIPVQNETHEVAFANPADISKSLIRSRNWSAVIIQELVDTTGNITSARKSLRGVEAFLHKHESSILSRVDKVPTVAVKNKDTQRAFVLNQASDEEKTLLRDTIETVEVWNGLLIELEGEKEQLEYMRRMLERTTDWLVQYINWHKFELRELV